MKFPEKGKNDRPTFESITSMVITVFQTINSGAVIWGIRAKQKA